LLRSGGSAVDSLIPKEIHMATVLTPPAPTTQPPALKPQPTPEAVPAAAAVPAAPAREDEVSGGDYWALLFLISCGGVLALMNLVDLLRGLLFR
jgi:hypothetical protein